MVAHRTQEDTSEVPHPFHRRVPLSDLLKVKNPDGQDLSLKERLSKCFSGVESYIWLKWWIPTTS